MQVTKSNTQQHLILPIQYLRGIAALMVVWHHARGQVPSIEALIPGNFGPSGVDLFFVISGFIMVVTTSGTSLGPAEFFKRRLVRVAPLYWFLTLLMITVALVFPSLFKTLQVSPVTLIQSLLFIPHFSHSFPNQIWPLLVPGWTLNYEMFFYAIFAVSLFLPERGRLAALVAFFLVLVAGGFVAGPFDTPSARIYTSPLLLEFVAGTLIGGWWIKGKFQLPLAASLLSISMGLTLLALRDSEPLGYFTQIIGATLAVIGALDVRFRAWHSHTLKALGDSSYSLYLTHLFTLGALRVVWAKIPGLTPSLFNASAFMLVSLLASAMVGWATYRWLESPLSQLVKKVVPRL